MAPKYHAYRQLTIVDKTQEENNSAEGMHVQLEDCSIDRASHLQLMEGIEDAPHSTRPWHVWAGCTGAVSAGILLVLYVIASSGLPSSPVSREPVQPQMVARLDGGRVGDQASRDDCPVCSEPQKMGKMPKELREGSGLGVSQLHPGIYYSMNDSPTSKEGIQVTAFTEDGSLKANFHLQGVQSTQGFGKGGQGDVESWATGPCKPGEDSHCIFVGDTGENCARPSEHCKYLRKSYSIMRFREPKTLPKVGAKKSFAGERFWFRYPDGQHDVESMFVAEGTIYVVTKQDRGKSKIFQLPELSPKSTVEAVHVGTHIHPPHGGRLFTGASYKKSGDWHGISLRTYSNIFYYPIAPGKTIKNALQAKPCDLPSGAEKLVQAEGVGWMDQGSGYITTGEAGDDGPAGTQAPILKVHCEAPKVFG